MFQTKTMTSQYGAGKLCAPCRLQLDFSAAFQQSRTWARATLYTLGRRGEWCCQRGDLGAPGFSSCRWRGWLSGSLPTHDGSFIIIRHTVRRRCWSSSKLSAAAAASQVGRFTPFTVSVAHPDRCVLSLRVLSRLASVCPRTGFFFFHILPGDAT